MVIVAPASGFPALVVAFTVTVVVASTAVAGATPAVPMARAATSVAAPNRDFFTGTPELWSAPHPGAGWRSLAVAAGTTGRARALPRPCGGPHRGDPGESTPHPSKFTPSQQSPSPDRGSRGNSHAARLFVSSAARPPSKEIPVRRTYTW